jgi:hypothetical protein
VSWKQKLENEVKKTGAEEAGVENSGVEKI